MATRQRTKTKIKIKPFVFGKDPQETPSLKIGLPLESVAVKSTQLASLVLTLIKFELVRRDAYPRWRQYLNQAGLRLWDLVAYMNVLYDDEKLIHALKAYWYKSKAEGYDKTALLREANELYEQLTDKISQVKAINGFSIHKIRNQEFIAE